MNSGFAMKTVIRFRLNGDEQELAVEPNLTLLDLLRERLHVTSPKRSCEQGECGACTVLLDGKAVNSCLTLGVSVNGRSVETVESLGFANLHPLQKHFYQMAASQCGYCTPGMILAAKAFLDENPDPTAEEVKQGLSGNLCRCTGYVKPIQAVLAAAKEMREGAEHA
ncbi:MAG: (2Fe-2S)-binding protein [Candidatus Korobacteraceae bacterium]|jgi:carbon-monoxide dehydrogenase small subunit